MRVALLSPERSSRETAAVEAIVQLEAVGSSSPHLPAMSQLPPSRPLRRSMPCHDPAWGKTPRPAALDARRNLPIRCRNLPMRCQSLLDAGRTSLVSNGPLVEERTPRLKSASRPAIFSPLPSEWESRPASQHRPPSHNVFSPPLRRHHPPGRGISIPRNNLGFPSSDAIGPQGTDRREPGGTNRRAGARTARPTVQSRGLRGVALRELARR